MDWEVLIPLLMFLFPLVVSILDKRAKKRKGIPPVKSAPVDTSSPFPFDTKDPGARPARRPAAQAPSQPVGWAPPSYDAEGGTVSTGRLPNPPEKGVEGERAITRHDEKKVVEEKPRLEIDKKKLILYSEILKPKFDA